jgi:hypothetical protein
MEETTEKNPPDFRPRRPLCANRNFWGTILIFFGLYFIARNLHWIPKLFPLFPALLIVIGVYLIFFRKNA